jgi:hypothetical protein
MDHMPGPVECQMFMNELGPDFGGGNHFVYEKVPKGKCSMLLSGRLDRGLDCSCQVGYLEGSL